MPIFAYPSLFLPTAVLQGDTEAIRALLAQGVSTEADALGQTPLYLAVEQGMLESVRLLAAVSSLEHVHPSTGFTALALALRNKQLDCARALLHAGADPNARIATGKRPTVLMNLVREKRHSSAHFLLRFANPDAQDDLGRTALHFAAQDDSAMVQKLLGAGANASIANHSGCTPLMMAAFHGKSAGVKCLLPVSDVHARDINGLAALDYANSGHGNERISALLRERMLLLDRAALSRAVVEGAACPASDGAAHGRQPPRRRPRAL